MADIYQDTLRKIIDERREKLRKKVRLESQKDLAAFGYSLKHADYKGEWLPKVPGGKNNRPAEKVLKGKVKGKKRYIGPSI